MKRTVQDLPSPCQGVNKDFSNSAGDHTAVGCDGVGGALSPGAGGQGNAQCGKDTFGHKKIPLAESEVRTRGIVTKKTKRNDNCKEIPNLAPSF